MDPAHACSDGASDGHRDKRPLSDGVGVVTDVHTQPDDEHGHSVASSHTPARISDDTDTHRASKAARTDSSSPMANTAVATVAKAAVARVHGGAGAGPASTSAPPGRFQSRFAITFGEGERSLAHPTAPHRTNTPCSTVPGLINPRLYVCIHTVTCLC